MLAGVEMAGSHCGACYVSVAKLGVMRRLESVDFAEIWAARSGPEKS